MAGKNNSSSQSIDLTSYTFIQKCGACHPGGGSAELDRNGNRYDKFAADPENNITSGGQNEFDGDYFKAKWAKSGVIEADCLICHLKDYHNEKRKNQITALNFRWAATAGAGFGEIKGCVSNGEKPKVSYNFSVFQENGQVVLPITREVRNEKCLFCHRESDWKKRGASFNSRTDVHIRAGLRCIDCHVTGRSAKDPRIEGRERHQIGKGDDPGGLVRNDLDNTMRSCEDCHSEGLLNAPVAKHRDLPPVHLEKIACQTCHIPWRQVKAALVEDASVFNTSPRITPPAKRIWSFYGPDIRPWNYYGFLHDYPEGLRPVFQFRPVVGWYKDKLYPLNRVYTLWVGIKKNNEKGIDQPYMKDVFMMWKSHRNDPDKNYPQLEKIKDDNRDGFPEVNRPEEIKALLASVTSMLKQKGESLEGKRVVFVDGNRYTANGIDWETLSKKAHEYSPYGSVFKFSHDIAPAQNALGAKGCTDCHSSTSDFFFKDIMVKPFDQSGEAVTQQNAAFMNFSPAALQLTVFEQEILKPYGFWILFAVFFLVILHYVIFGPKDVRGNDQDPADVRFSIGERVIHYVSVVLFALLTISGLITFSAIPFSSGTIGIIHTFHHYAGYLFVLNMLLIAGIWFRDVLFEKSDWQWLKKLGNYFGYQGRLPADRFNAGQKLYFWFMLLLVAILGITGVMIIWTTNSNLGLIAHTIHTVAAFIVIVTVIVHAYLGTLANPGTLKGIFEGKVIVSGIDADTKESLNNP
ncbi:MAG: cytochrome b/b6 domain-containing protein [Desulfobacterales bacterium]|nr:cytochrome b/b6 domain-containing protein [Desulfobacterales bacterium]